MLGMVLIVKVILPIALFISLSLSCSNNSQCLLFIQASEGTPIQSVDDWFKYAPPKMGEKHWKAGHSAKELAKAWFRDGFARVPAELELLFRSHPITDGVVVEIGIPEKQTPLDDFKGETRNTDLMLSGHTRDARVVVGIEAKADEPFGNLIAEELEKSKQKPTSKVPDRIDLLSRSIFGRPVDEGISQLRYQLLHGVAAALIEAKERNAGAAVFVGYEFLSDSVKAENVERNASDFEKFIHALPECENVDVRTGILIGPVRVPGGKYVPGDVPLLIGKVTTDLRKK
jgi:hypothetical protein